MAQALKPKDGYILGPRADWPLLILAPLLALVLGLALAQTPLGTRKLSLFGSSGTFADGLISVFITGHLVLVFFRTHANPAIHTLHPWRFDAVPALLLALLLSSNLAQALAAAVAVWWDVYHSSLQTFGLCRIYERKAGHDPEEGRALDWWLNVLIYLGPVLAGAKLAWHAAAFYEFSGTSLAALSQTAPLLLRLQQPLRWALAGAGIPFVACYLHKQQQLRAKGRGAPIQKTALLCSTALCSIWAWGFNPFGMALFIMNFFHALQYFALVWHYEEGNISRVLRAPQGARGRAFALAGFCALGLLYGAFGAVVGELNKGVYCLTLVVSLMHFWWDGFVWSVRARQV